MYIVHTQVYTHDVELDSFTFETYAESDQELSPLVSSWKGLLKSDLDG